MCCHFIGRLLVVNPVTWKDDEVPFRLYGSCRLESSPDIMLLDFTTNGHALVVTCVNSCGTNPLHLAPEPAHWHGLS